ncbi:MAG TPA: hypothetical protein VGC44_14940 [Longimicrobiales bacterium]
MNRSGFALVFVLLVVAAVELLSLSIISLAAHENVVAATQERTLQDSRAAEAALRRLIRAWPAGLDSLQPTQSATIADTAGIVITVRRNTWGQFLATAAQAGRARPREIAILETLDLERALSEANRGFISSGPLTAPATRFSVDPTSCPLPFATSPPDTSLLRDPGYAFGGLSWPEAASIADSGFVYVDRSHVIPAGTHSGVLIVQGDLLVENGADYTGLIVLSGSLQIEDGVHIAGAVMVRSGAPAVMGAADLTFSRCAVSRALVQSPAARRLVGSSRRFLPAF